jgi:hypothetical protein
MRNYVDISMTDFGRLIREASDSLADSILDLTIRVTDPQKTGTSLSVCLRSFMRP